ncbi:hypothetical protein D3C83_55400 [compost metagenome]
MTSDGTLGGIRRCATAELSRDGGALFYPQAFPHWQPRPDTTQDVRYRPSALPALAARFALLHEVTAPDAFMTEMPTYRTWDPGAAPA